MEVVMPEMAEMKKQVDTLVSLFGNMLVATKQKSTVTIKDIAVIEGVSVNQLRKGGTQRYLLPRFGASGYPTGTVRWDMTEFMAWHNRDPRERRAAYLAFVSNRKSK